MCVAFEDADRQRRHDTPQEQLRTQPHFEHGDGVRMTVLSGPLMKPASLARRTLTGCALILCHTDTDPLPNAPRACTARGLPHILGGDPGSAAILDESSAMLPFTLTVNHPLLRMSEAPRVEGHLVLSSEAPGGVGELGVPLIAAAVANAVFAATGQRVRTLPLRLA